MNTVYLAALAPLAWMTVTDIRKRKIPAAPLILLAALGVMKVVITGASGILPAIVGLICVGLLMLVLSCVFDYGDAIGGGDVKLCAALGLLLGTVDALILIAESLVLLVCYAAAGGKKDAPFAPFVLAAYAVTFAIIIIGGYNV